MDYTEKIVPFYENTKKQVWKSKMSNFTPKI